MPDGKRRAIYTRKSPEEGLEQEFNSLQAQSEACGAYIRSQRHEGWVLARTRYDDGGFSGGNSGKALCCTDQQQGEVNPPHRLGGSPGSFTGREQWRSFRG
jgi:hypothetical protein